jgi:SAM-dependent methyltransferase
MGIPLFGFEYLCEAVKRFAIRGTCLTLGKQDMYFGVDSLRAVMKRQGFLSTAMFEDIVQSEAGKSRHPGLAAQGWISDVAAFSSIGLSVSSVDDSDFEGADIIHDLNAPGLADKAGQFDLIIDGGTIEHVFHLPNALQNVCESARVGGIVYHASPVNNYVDHGFYQLSPTLFYDFYTANDWEILQAQLLRHGKNPDEDLRFFMDYRPGTLDAVSFGGFDNAMYLLEFFARKKPSSSTDRVAQQGYYTRRRG